MNIKYFKLAVVAAYLVASSVAFAGPGHEHGSDDHSQEHTHGGGGEDLHDKSAEELFTSLEGTVEKVTAAVNSRELGKLHDLTGDISHLVSHIAEKVSADKQVRVTGSIHNILAITSELHLAADKNDQATAEQKLKRLQGMMAVLKGQLA